MNSKNGVGSKEQKRKSFFAAKKWNRFLLKTFAVFFLLINVMSIFHAYRFTHYTNSTEERIGDASKLGLWQKLNTAVFGVKNPKPVNKKFPPLPYKIVKIGESKPLNCWLIEHANAKGLVILFHGYSSCKSEMLERADSLLSAQYATLLVDFNGSGESEGNQTTIGYKESEQVLSCYSYAKQNRYKNIYLLGSSMGAAAILKAVYEYKLTPNGVILECPFASLHKAVGNRMNLMNMPKEPLTSLLVFWGGTINGFWAFGFSPEEYAKQVQCPTLLIYGTRDKKVNMQETQSIFQNLAEPKFLKLYSQSGHADYLKNNPKEWTWDVRVFLNQYRK